MDRLILIGKLSRDYDGNVSIIQNSYTYNGALSVLIGDFIEENSNKLSSMYTLEDVEEKYLEKILGSIDISVENIGYSEYTITDYSIENFKLGGHDLEKIFSNYIGKYVCIIVDKEELCER